MPASVLVVGANPFEGGLPERPSRKSRAASRRIAAMMAPSSWAWVAKVMRWDSTLLVNGAVEEACAEVGAQAVSPATRHNVSARSEGRRRLFRDGMVHLGRFA